MKQRQKKKRKKSDKPFKSSLIILSQSIEQNLFYDGVASVLKHLFITSQHTVYRIVLKLLMIYRMNGFGCLELTYDTLARCYEYKMI